MCLPVMIAGLLISQQLARDPSPKYTIDHVACGLSNCTVNKASVVKPTGKTDTANRINLLRLVRFDWNTERRPIKTPDGPDNAVAPIAKKATESATNMLVGIYVYLNMDSTLVDRDIYINWTHPKSITRIRKISVVRVIGRLCFSKNALFLDGNGDLPQK